MLTAKEAHEDRIIVFELDIVILLILPGASLLRFI